MKNTFEKVKLTYIPILILLFVFAYGCKKDETIEISDNNTLSTDEQTALDYTYDESEQNLTIYSCLDSLPYEDLSDEEIEALMLMREEEYLAHDVYLAFSDIYTKPVFGNIKNSELFHTNAVKAIFEKYALEDPAANHVAGEFTIPELQVLYDSLVSVGSNSLMEALGVGALIEDLDIVDLHELLEDVVDNEDITFVFENLMRGSRNHLRAYYGNIVFLGGEYTPVFLTQEEFDEIVNAEHEPGSGFCTCFN